MLAHTQKITHNQQKTQVVIFVPDKSKRYVVIITARGSADVNSIVLRHANCFQMHS